MAVAARLQLALLRQAGDLAQPRQRVELAEDGDHRPALSRLAHHRGRQPGDPGLDAEALQLQHRPMLGGGAVLLVVKLRRLPDPAAAFDIALAPGLDQARKSTRMNSST